MENDGYLKNCIIKPDNTQNGPMFISRVDGTIVPNLDGYAIIPRREYEALIAGEENSG